ncbi:MAG: class IV adenylate cyclase [Halodesulfurarchaeum sp.]
MYEVELKVRAAHEAVRPALDAAGASERETVEQRDVYFDAPHRDLASRDEALRLREETDTGGTTAVLTFKGPRLDRESQTRTEYETAIGSPAELKTALEALGFEPAATVEKTRERFELDGFTVSLDSVAELGEFVEVETTASEADIEQAQRAVAATLERLGLDPEAQISTSYLELLLDESNGSEPE